MRARLGSIVRHALLATAMLALARAGHAEEPATPPAPEASQAPEPGDIDEKAVALVKRMGDYVRAQPRFRFTVDQSYDVVQDDGEKLEFGGVRTYTVRRPDRLRIEGDRRDGSPRTLYFDGSQIAVSIPAEKAYALVKMKERRDLDTTLSLAQNELDIQVPLAGLLRSEPTKEILDGLMSAYIVGKETLAGVACQHVAMRTDEVDAQLWIATGDQPVPRRVVIEYRNVEGQPRYTAEFSSWSMKPDVADSVFAFSPPKGAERVRFIVRGRDLQPPEEPTP